MTSLLFSLLLLSAKPAPQTLPPIIVKGTPPAPSVVYVLQKSSTKPAPLELKKSFVPKILSSVPF